MWYLHVRIITGGIHGMNQNLITKLDCNILIIELLNNIYLISMKNLFEHKGTCLFLTCIHPAEHFDIYVFQ